MKLPYAGVMQIAPYREGGGNFTRGCITFFYNILFFQVIPHCPGPPITLEENSSWLYFSHNKAGLLLLGKSQVLCVTTTTFPRKKSCPAGSNGAALYFRGINCPNPRYSRDLHFLSNISSEHFGVLDQLLARHSFTSHCMHWPLLHKL